jgi:DNA-binding CsgD family transcriptional regulator
MIGRMGDADVLTRGRAAFERNAWDAAFSELTAADRVGSLEPDDLDRLATAAYLVGDDAASQDARARAHAAFLDRGDPVRAARCALSVAFVLFDRPSQRAQAGGWLGRARRLLEECGRESVEHGVLLCAQAFQQMGSDLPAALAGFEQATAVGARFRDPDVTTLARHGQARALLRMNRRADGFALIDEVMVAVTGGEVSPIVAGMVYCSVIRACHDVFDLGRAQEWTDALARWCAAHPAMVPFRGQCLVRRSELMQMHGAWEDALAEARRAADWLTEATAEPVAGAVHYQQAELFRMRGDLASADDAYRRASQAGRRPEPGLALLRLAQGQVDTAGAAVRRMLQETKDKRVRARLLGAAVEIMLAQRDVPSAGVASDELSALAGEFAAPLLQAASAQAAGAVALADGHPEDALERLRDAWTLWRGLDVPYEVARVRELVGLAYRGLGDHDGAQLEFEAAQETFERLGATRDSARVAALVAPPATRASGALTGREVEVLRLVAAGKTNRAIAASLDISEKTVARHLSNIFTKLDLPSRSAATAYAYEHKLL